MEKLILDFDIPDFLEDDIESMVKSVNNKESIVDCWQETIRADLNCCDGALTDEQIKMLRDYYYVREWANVD